MSSFEKWVHLTREVFGEACGEYKDEELAALAAYLRHRAWSATDSDVAVDMGILGDMLALPRGGHAKEEGTR